MHECYSTRTFYIICKKKNPFLRQILSGSGKDGLPKGTVVVLSEFSWWEKAHIKLHAAEEKRDTVFLRSSVALVEDGD